ncbi:MAG: hypothetical protein ACLFO1_04645 [Spirochaetaceae bacterium]
MSAAPEVRVSISLLEPPVPGDAVDLFYLIAVALRGACGFTVIR